MKDYSIYYNDIRFEGYGSTIFSWGELIFFRIII